jgi:PEP-CTERM motif
MKLKLFFLFLVVLLPSVTLGSVSMNFSLDYSSGVPSGFSDASGIPADGMLWGILIDGSGNGIAGNYDIPAAGLAAGQNYIMGISGLATDDVLWTSASYTENTISSVEGDGITTGNTGGFYNITGIDLLNGVDGTDKFYIVWFSGNKVGVLSDASFTIPAEGGSSDYGTPFVGVDPVRSAGKSYSGIDGVSTGPGIQLSLVPEPSSAFLASLGALGLLRRRRN